MYHLAQLNVARMTMPYEDPGMKDFIEALDPVNAAADRSPGFVWRLVSDHCEDPVLVEFEASGWLVNMSLWQDLESLRQFVTSPIHLSIMKRRAEWFAKWPEATMVLWWVEAGHIPAFSEALSRLEWLREHGPGARAFSFARPFEQPVSPVQYAGG
ncbi:MAG: DUF3291 domain-containing protein [Xanthomonadales bacterium]|nr:DUF3291 domain-containing protein [Gammaproteobacteria bacterium]NNL95838.1 DUF3291 domain-containing protein [Xanthomonadales bacterium]